MPLQYRRRLLLFLMLLFALLGISFQAYSADESLKLRDSLRKTGNDSRRASLYLKLARYFKHQPAEMPHRLDSMLLYVNKGLQLSTFLQNDVLRNKAWGWLANYYILIGQNKPATTYQQKIIHYYQRSGNFAGEAAAWKSLGDLLDEGNAAPAEKLKCFNAAYNLYHKHQDYLPELDVYQRVAIVHMQQGRLKLAEHELFDMLKRYRALGFNDLYIVYDLLAKLNELKPDLHGQLYYRMEAVKSLEGTGKKNTAYYHYEALAAAYADLAFYQQSMFWVLKALEAMKSEEQKSDYYGVFSLGVFDLIREGRAQEAFLFLQHYSKLSPPTSSAQKVDLNEMYANCYAALHKYGLAEQYYLKMMSGFQYTRFRKDLYIDHTEMMMDYVHYYKSLGVFYVTTGKFEKGKWFLKELLNLPPVYIRPFNLSEIHQNLFKVDSARKNYLQAINHYQIYKRINDSLFNDTKTKQIKDIQDSYEKEKKERKLQLQLKSAQLVIKQTQLKQSQAEKVRIIRNSLIIVLVLLLALVYYRYKVKQKNNMQLEEQQKEISAKNNSLKRLLDENELLLREVHHRVKNNLQIVKSLLNSQSSYLKDEVALKAVMESQHRISAMSLIHQKLYRADDAFTVYMPEYINELVSYLEDSFNAKEFVYFDLQIAPLELDVARALPLGLILNELITNALKYAFPAGAKGVLKVKMSIDSASQVSLLVNDNGPGLPEGFEANSETSFGMTLIKGLTEDLDGQLSFDSKNGTAVTIVFHNSASNRLEAS
jgi:two-component sensor histidine kinase